MKEFIKKILKKDNQKNIAVIELKGVIATSSRHLNLSNLLPTLTKLEKTGKKFDAIALIVNSPGGSPAQSSLIAARLRYIAKKHELPIYAFVEDVAASGGYWLACAGDEIYGDMNSIVGSIGVISSGFGFVELIEKIGVERRVYTSGENKSQMDPFKPENEEDIQRIKEIQQEIHQGFIDWVKERRASRLDENQNLFTGEFWTAQKASELGLIDGLAHAYPWLKEKFGDKANLKTFEKPQSMLKKLLGKSQMQDMPDAFIQSLKEQKIWSRFNL